MKIMKWRMLHATAKNFEKDLAIQLNNPACPNVSQTQRLIQPVLVKQDKIYRTAKHETRSN